MLSIKGCADHAQIPPESEAGNPSSIIWKHPKKGPINLGISSEVQGRYPAHFDR